MCGEFFFLWSVLQRSLLVRIRNKDGVSESSGEHFRARLDNVCVKIADLGNSCWVVREVRWPVFSPSLYERSVCVCVCVCVIL
jgi:hypothetical protein